MKKTFVFLFLFVCTFTNAQKLNLSGKVVDENNDPLPGATILIKEINIGKSTSFDGKFQFSLSKRSYTIQISFIGYNTLERKIELNSNVSLNFKLIASENVLDEVLVSAIRANSNTPVTYTNLDKKEIAKRNLGQDIPILLNYLPSVISSSDAGTVGYTYMNVRGSNGERINVTINGIPYNDAESHGTFWVNLGDFASSTQNLQLQRGVGTSTNGASAFGASLNILTDAISKTASGEVSNSFGSFGTRKHTVKFTTGQMNNHFEISGRLSNIYSDGYVDRAFADLKSYFLQAAYSDENTLIKAITFGGTEQTYQAWFGLTEQQLEEDRRQNPYTYDNEIDDYKQNHYQLHWNERWSNNWSTNIGLNYTQGAGFFEQFKEDENASDFNNLIVNGSDVIVRRWLDNDFYVANFNVNYENKSISFVSGISYSNYTNDHFGEVIWGSDLAPNTSIRDHYYFSDAKKTDFSIFTKTTFPINENLIGFIDLQGRFINYQTEGLTSNRTPIDVDSQFNFFNPKVGFTYSLNENSKLYISYARANREPNRNDFEVEIRKHETMDDFELGWRFKSEKVTFNSNLYFMNYKNQLVLTGELNDVGENIRQSVDKSYRLGLELDAQIKLTNTLTWSPNLTISQNRIKDFPIRLNGVLTNLKNTPISFSPNVIAGNIISFKPEDNFQISLLSKFVGKQWMSNLNSNVSNSDVLDSYFVSDLNLVYSIKPKKVFNEVTFKGLINNIFNEKYVNRGYYGIYDYDDNGNTVTDDYAGFYPQATINFLLGVTLNF